MVERVVKLEGDVGSSWNFDGFGGSCGADVAGNVSGGHILHRRVVWRLTNGSTRSSATSDDSSPNVSKVSVHGRRASNVQSTHSAQKHIAREEREKQK